jgi:hypothetical protein
MNEIQETADEKMLPPDITPEVLNKYDQALTEQFFDNESKVYEPFISAAAGSIPWVGSLLVAISDYEDKKTQGKINDLDRLWLREHEKKIKELFITISEILKRLNTFGDDVKKRIQSPEYLQLVRQSFRAWDQVDTEDKRQKIKNLLTNAGAITLCPDDLIRLFISWIERYHESHFIVITQIYQNQPITRGDIWDRIHPKGRPRDDSAEAGLYSYLIRELSLGGVIHQQKVTNSDGSYLRNHRRSSGNSSSDTLESAFEDTKPYVLTELGKEFVRYVIEGATTQIGGQQTTPQ